MLKADEKSKLNEGIVKALPSPDKGNKVHYFAGAELQGMSAPRGFGVRVTSGGAKAFILNYRLQAKEYRYTIGAYPDWTPLLAVRAARTLRQRIDRGENPLDDRKPVEVPAVKTIAAILDDFEKRYLEGETPLRSAPFYKMAFKNHVRPILGKTDVLSLKRSDLARLLDAVEDKAGPVAADRCRAYFRKALAWYAERDDDFNLNAVFGRVQPRSNCKDRARTRVLADDELRHIWPCLAGAGTFGALVKTLLLTAQRRDEVSNMVRAEIDDAAIWAIPAERYKTKRPNFVPLSAAALVVIEAQWNAITSKAAVPAATEAARIKKPRYVFPSSARTPFSAFSKGKRELDKAIADAMQESAGTDAEIAAIPNWTLHDLRRTAKTLMMRAGVRPDISERVLGHVIAGVEGTYDRHTYANEKRDALEKLADLITKITDIGQPKTAGD